MKIIENYSHFNGLEFLLVNKPAMWQEIISIIHEVDANMYHDPVPKKRMMAGKIFYHPGELESTFKRHFDEKSWEESKDFIKDRIGVKTHFVKDSSIAYDKHLAREATCLFQDELLLARLQIQLQPAKTPSQMRMKNLHTKLNK